MKAITEFQGDYRWLSNFWPVDIVLDGNTYPSVEHAYVAAKRKDPAFRRAVLNAKTPGAAKRLGRNCIVRSDWPSVKLQFMEAFLRQKFADPELRALLVATGTANIVEGNNWRDRYWGVYQGEGQNHLGRLIMKIRSEL